MEDNEYMVKGFKNPIRKFSVPFTIHERSIVDVDGRIVASIRDVEGSMEQAEEIVKVTESMVASGLKYLPEKCETVKVRKYSDQVTAIQTLNIKKILKWKKPIKLDPPAPIHDPEDGTHEGT